MAKLQNNSKLKKKKNQVPENSLHMIHHCQSLWWVKTDQEEQKGEEKKEICETIR